MAIGPNERRALREQTSRAAKEQIDNDINATRRKTARLKEQRLEKEVADKAAQAEAPKPAKARVRSRKAAE